MTAPHHICFAVIDLAPAMSQLAELGVSFGEIRTDRIGDWDYEIVFSRSGPPFFELIHGAAGSPWDASTGPRCDHIGYWSADLDRDKRTLTDRGLPVEFDACPLGRSFSYHRADSLGIRVELVDHASQPGFLQTWASTAAPMPALVWREDDDE